MIKYQKTSPQNADIISMLYPVQP